jgi:hypothetical protein
VKGLVVALLCLSLPVRADETKLDLSSKSKAVAESHSLRPDSVFGPGLRLTTFGEDRVRLEEELRGKAGPVQLLVTGSVLSQQRQRANSRIVANEVYTDFAVDRNHFTVGKKILSGDVGYGFRPIDVIQREPRLQILPPALEGVPNLAWERFTAEEAWSLIYANPGHGRRIDAKHDGSLNLRWYRRAGKTDLHGVARASDRYGLEAGGAFSTVPHESLELHASVLFMKRDESGKSREKALAGLTWTFESGWSLVGEAWWDGTAPGAEDWRALNARAGALQANPPALAGLTRVFQLPSWSRRSALAHASWTDPAGSGWSGYLDLLRTLEDRGYSVTAALGYEADKVRVDAGLRRFGGRPDSAYRLFPEKDVLFVGISLAL